MSLDSENLAAAHTRVTHWAVTADEVGYHCDTCRGRTFCDTGLTSYTYFGLISRASKALATRISGVGRTSFAKHFLFSRKGSHAPTHPKSHHCPVHTVYCFALPCSGCVVLSCLVASCHVFVMFRFALAGVCYFSFGVESACKYQDSHVDVRHASLERPPGKRKFNGLSTKPCRVARHPHSYLQWNARLTDRRKIGT